MKLCLKCKNPVPKHLWVDGQKKNLQNRKFCLDCSPWGSHNTRNLNEKNNHSNIHKRTCSDCGREFNCQNKNGSKRKGKLCYACYFNKKEESRNNKVYAIVGESCWYCGYNKGKLGRRILAFHHIDPSQKKFGLSSRETTAYKWDRVVEEMKKCALLCCRCHNEVHYGLIEPKEILEIYKKNWTRSSEVSSG